jgi:hypothetical protein
MVTKFLRYAQNQNDNMRNDIKYNGYQKKNKMLNIKQEKKKKERKK